MQDNGEQFPAEPFKTMSSLVIQQSARPGMAQVHPEKSPFPARKWISPGRLFTPAGFIFFMAVPGIVPLRFGRGRNIDNNIKIIHSIWKQGINFLRKNSI